MLMLCSWLSYKICPTDVAICQVFATVNSFLREDPAARKRRLHVFTYTIVPLSPDSGVLEWVEDTMPFGSFLTDRGSGKPGAHRRYFPKDWCVCVPIFFVDPHINDPSYEG